MIMKWNPRWYGLDQSIIVGDTDLFYLQKEEHSFANGALSIEDEEVEAIILKITHPILGQIKGILTKELDYSIFLDDGEIVIVNAEEEPGKVYNQHLNINDWCMEVDLQILKKTGLTSYERISRLTDLEKVEEQRVREAKYRELLGIRLGGG